MARKPTARDAASEKIDAAAKKIDASTDGPIADSGATAMPEPLPAEGDEDADGISNGDELRLGTSPLRFDTDNDGLGDAEEIGDLAAPLDGDDDGIIDALEHPWFDNDLDGEYDPADPWTAQQGWQLVSAGFDPAAIINDGNDASMLEVHLTRREGVSRVRAGISPTFRHPNWLQYALTVDGQPIGTDPVELFDDGSHGDRIANDGVFTRQGFSSAGTVVSSNGVRGMTYLNTLYVTKDGSEQEHVFGQFNEDGFIRVPAGGFGLGILAEAGLVTVTEMREDLRHTSHVLNVVDAALAARIPDSMNGGPRPLSVKQELTAKLLQYFDADVDMLYLFLPRPALAGLAGLHMTLHNQVQGIGLPVIPMPEELGPTQSLNVFDFMDELPIGHETMHRWGVFLDPSLGFSTDIDPHWGVAGTYGVLGGFDPATLIDHGDGTFTVDRFSLAGNDWTTTPFSDIELYLMGLLPPEELEPFPVFSDVEPVNVEDPETVTLRATRRMVSVDDIIAVHGPRLPAFGDAQTAYRAACVVVSERPLTPAELGLIHHHAETFGLDTFAKGMTFAESTGGRATLDTSLPPLKP